MIIPKKIVSKRETYHLTNGKYYDVINTIVSKTNVILRYIIISDRGKEIDTSANNFYSISELRNIKLKEIIHATH